MIQYTWIWHPEKLSGLLPLGKMLEKRILDDKIYLLCTSLRDLILKGRKAWRKTWAHCIEENYGSGSLWNVKNVQSSKPNPSNWNPLPEKFDFLNPCYLHGFLIYLWLFTLFWCFHHFMFHLKKTWLKNKHLDEIPVNLWWLMCTHFISTVRT